MVAAQDMQALERRLGTLEQTHANFVREVDREKAAFMDNVQLAFASQENKMDAIINDAKGKFAELERNLTTLANLTDMAVKTMEEKMRGVESRSSGSGGYGHQR